MNNIRALSLLAGAFFLMSLNSDTPRGIRNNNPLNIRHSGANNWLGQVGSDGSFVIFDTAVNGIRAAARLIGNYGRLYGVNTLEGIIARWAPAIENNTESYINHAASKLGVSRSAIIDESMYPALIKVMILHENGVQPYSDDEIQAGVVAAYA